MKNLETDAVTKFVMFSMNYPHNWIEKCWSGSIGQHLQGKWNDSHEKYGSVGVMMDFYCKLDGGNREILTQFINYTKI